MPRQILGTVMVTVAAAESIIAWFVISLGTEAGGLPAEAIYSKSFWFLMGEFVVLLATAVAGLGIRWDRRWGISLLVTAFGGTFILMMLGLGDLLLTDVAILTLATLTIFLVLALILRRKRTVRAGAAGL